MLTARLSRVKLGVGENANNTTLELQQDLARSTPQQCVTLTHSVPSAQMYCALHTKLENCTDKWLQDFLQLDGLDSLLESLDQLSGKGFTCFSDAVLQIDCLSCIRCILNSALGLEYFIDSDVYVKKLTMALNSCDTIPKKQVFEILSAILVFNNIGYLRVIEALAHVKTECDQFHRFTLIVNDLQKSDSLGHKTAIVTFINALINATPNIADRIRIRNEFIGLNLLDVLSLIRKDDPDDDLLLQLEVFHERKMSDEEAMNTQSGLDYNSPQDLLDQIQSRVFGSPRMVNFVNILQDLLAVEAVYSDNSNKLWQAIDSLVHHVIHTMTPSGVNNLQSELHRLPDHISLGLECIFSYQDCMKPSNNDKASTNNHLFTDELTMKMKDFNDDTLKQEKLLAADCESQNDTYWKQASLTRNMNARTPLTPSVNSLSDSSMSNNSSSQNRTVVLNSLVKKFQNTSCNHSNTTWTQNEQKDFYSPTDITFFSKRADTTTSPSSNLENDMTNNNSVEIPSKSCHGNSSQGNRTFDVATCRNTSDGMNINHSEEKVCLYDQKKFGKDIELKQMKNDCPQNDLQKETYSSSCTELNVSCGGTLKEKQTKPSNKLARERCPAPSSPLSTLRWIALDDDVIVGRECVWLSQLAEQEKLSIDYGKLEKAFQVKSSGRTDAVEEVVLLNANSRLKINLFLSRLDSGAEDLVQNLQDGNTNQLSLPMMQYLNKIIPCPEEVQMLRGYTGPRLELGMAEQFVLLLSDISDYTVLLAGHLVRAEFEASIPRFQMALTTMVDLSRLVLNNTGLRRLMQLVLMLGNFLNYGHFSGDSAGFKLSSLGCLQELKTLAPCRTLLHFIVQSVTEQDKEVLTFVKKIIPMEKAARAILALLSFLSFSMEEMKADIGKLNAKLRDFMHNLSLTDTVLQQQFQPFIDTLKKEFGSIQWATTELRTLTDQLAEYFCEDETRFNLQDCFNTLLSFCREVRECQEDLLSHASSHVIKRPPVDVQQKKLRMKLMSLEFGQNAGASSSILEEKNKVMDRMLDQLHKGNYQPCVKSELPTPDSDCGQAHPLEMSCIPFEDSPTMVGRKRLGTGFSDNVFLDTPELVSSTDNIPGDHPRMTRSSTIKIQPIRETCTAQTCVDRRQTSPVRQNDVPLKQPEYLPSPLGTDGKKPRSLSLQRKLFPGPPVVDDGAAEPRKMKVKTQLTIPARKGTHRRSRSDMVDSYCGTDKWVEYEKMRDLDAINGKRAPIAEPESICNLSILNLEKQGKFITKKDFVQLDKDEAKHQGDHCDIAEGPIIKLPDDRVKRGEKKSSVGGFFSKIGRAVLKPRNVYSDGDQYVVGKETDQRKKSFSSVDKENIVKSDPSGEDKKTKVDGNKVSRFFQRGGLYRSSKMKKKNQNLAN